MTDNRYPITIITGFLGSGKTTLLNRILSEKRKLNIAVFVNDFGAINIDADLVVGVKDDVVSLANGCVCCNIRDDLVNSIKDVIESNKHINSILLEASGVADPISIATTFNNPAIQDQIVLENIVCLVDTEQFFNHWEYEELKRLKTLQIGCADLVLLNKIDVASRENIEKVKSFIDDQFNRIRMIETSEANIPMALLFSEEYRKDTQIDMLQTYDHTKEHHGEQFSKWSFESDETFDLTALEEMVKRELPASVYRCKGVLYINKNKENRFLLQIVGRRIRIIKDENKSKKILNNQIVAIGDSEKMNKQHLTQLFEKCLIVD